MNFNLKLYYLTVKRILHSTFFYVMCILVVLIYGLLGRVLHEAEGEVRVLVAGNADQILDDQGFEGVSFIKASSREELIDEVTIGRASCGMIFPEDIRDEQRVVFYQNSSMAEGYFVKELVFPSIQRALSNVTLEKYMIDSDPSVPEEIIADVLNYNEEYVNSHQIGIFRTEYVNVNGKDGNRIVSIKLFVFLLCFVLCAILFATELYHRDINLIQSIPRTKRGTIFIASAVLACACMSVVSFILFKIVFFVTKLG